MTQSGLIRLCMEDTLDGLSVSDMLRDALVNDDSENAELFSEDEKREFLYQVVCSFAF